MATRMPPAGTGFGAGRSGWRDRERKRRAVERARARLGVVQLPLPRAWLPRGPAPARHQGGRDDDHPNDHRTARPPAG